MLDRYIQFLEANDKSRATVKTYQGELQKFRDWTDQQGLANLLEVTPIDVQEYRRDMQNLKRMPATINKALVVIKNFYRWCVEEVKLQSNPADKVKLVERQQQAPKWLERPEQHRLKRAVLQEKNEFNRLRDMAAVMLMMGAGLRVEEVVDLNLDDIEMGERRGKVVVRKGKRGKYREVPLNAETRKAIIEYLAVRSNNNHSTSFNDRGGH
jgi:site-specific recombinase XerD